MSEKTTIEEAVKPCGEAAPAGDGIWSRGAVRLDTAMTKYGFKRTTLYALLGKELPYARTSAGRVVPVSAIEAWLESRTVAAAN